MEMELQSYPQIQRNFSFYAAGTNRPGGYLAHLWGPLSVKLKIQGVHSRADFGGVKPADRVHAV